MGFFLGVPFKFNTSSRNHDRYIYGVAFSPDGASIVSVGADRKIWLYDGKTGEPQGQIGDGEHKGSIFSVSWARDSKRFVTSSADQTVKIWDAEAGRAVQTWRMGEEGSVTIPDHQVGVVWPAGRSDGLIISLNLAGDLNYLSEGSGKPHKIVQGHQKNITSLAASNSAARSQTLFTGSSDGRICSWDTSTGFAETVDGESHTNYVSGIAASHEGPVYSVGWDDALRSLDPSAKTFTGSSAKTDGQPKGVATANGCAFVATHKGISIFKSGELQKHLPTSFSPTTIAASKDLLAVGADDMTLHIYSSTSLSPITTIPDPSSLITTLAFSPTTSLLAVGFSSGKIAVYDTKSWEVSISRWSAHTGRVTSIAWHEGGKFAVSGGLDTNIFVWSVESPGKRVRVGSAHKEGVNGVGWGEGGRTVVSVGGDAAVKRWRVEGVF